MYTPRVIVRLFLFAMVLCVVDPVWAQLPANAIEEDVKKQAVDFFDKEDYASAFPLYSQLLANYPKDPNYNYCFGVCMLYGNADKAKSLPYLEFASKSQEVNADVWFYLGRAYHLNYRFDDAIKAYSQYRMMAGNRRAEKKQINNQIAMCKTGKRLLKTITDIEVIEKKELSRKDFFRSYDLSGYSGQLLVKPDDFKTTLDNKKNEASVIFLSTEKNELYFSSYGNNEENGKDIYVIRRLPNGEWSKPQSVGYPINTEYDEDYPFLHPNGKVLYFSSKGHSSMGGYDIFRSDLNEETNTWQKPVNLDFAINTPDDDILYITDLEEKTAYFASSRNSPDGSISVYHVKIERKPVEYCIIRGNFAPFESSPNRSSRILVKNAENDEIIGVYKSNEATGNYLINLPNGGKFTFTVEKNGVETQTEQVSVPQQYQIKPVRQEIGYKESKGQMRLYINTYFTDDSLDLPPAFLRDKARLDVNDSTTIKDESGNALPPVVSKPAPAPVVDTVVEETPIDTVPVATEIPTPSTNKLDNEELVKIALNDAKESQGEAAELKQKYERAFSFAADLNEQARNQQNQADQARKSGNTQQADQLQLEAATLQNQTIAAFNLADALERDANAKTEEAKQDELYATQLQQAVKSKSAEAVEKLNKDQQRTQYNSEDRSEAKATLANLKTETEAKKAELDKVQKQIADLKVEIEQSAQQADQLRADAKTEKKADLKQGMLDQANGIDEDIVANREELSKLENKANNLNGEAIKAEQQYTATSKALNQIESTTYDPKPIGATTREELKNDVRAYEKQVGVILAAASTSKNPVDAPNTTQVNGTEVPGQDGSSAPQPSVVVSQPKVTTGPPLDDPTTKPSNTTESVNNSTVKEEIAASYGQQLEKTATITDLVARERLNSSIHENWAESIDSAIVLKKEQVAKSTDSGTKQKLTAEIAELQKESDLHHKQATEAANKARATEPVVGTSPTPTTSNPPTQSAEQGNIPQPPAASSTVKDDPLPTAATINSGFEQQVQATALKTNKQERQKEEITLYENWADTLEAAAVAREKRAQLITDNTKKADLNNEVKALRSQAEEKRKQANKIQTESSPPPVVTTKSDQPASATPADAQQTPYTTTVAVLTMKARQNVLQQASELREERDSLNKAAGLTSGDEKDRLLREATDIQRKIWEKESQATEQLGTANASQFNKNAELLKGYQDASNGNNAAQVEAAGLLIDESRALFDAAEANRKVAVATPNDPFARDENLRKAEANEEQALKKQQQAIERYKQAGIQPSSTIASAPSSQPKQTASDVPSTPPPPVVKPISSVDAPVVVSGPASATINKIANNYTEQLNATNTISDEATRERKKAEIYDKWAGALDSVIAAKQSLVEVVSDPQQKSKFQLEIANLQREMDQRQAQASSSMIKSQQADIAAGRTIDNGVSENASNTTTLNDQSNSVNTESTVKTQQQLLTTAPATDQTAQQINPENPFDESKEVKIVGVVVNPSTNAPFEADELEVVRNSPAYRSYVEVATQADEAQVESTSQRRQAAKYEASANALVAEAQEFTNKAANETNAARKKTYFEQATAANNEAKRDMAKRDSMLELSTNTSSSAKAKRSEAELLLKSADQTLQEQVKVVTKAERIGNPVEPQITSVANQIKPASTTSQSGTNAIAQQNASTSSSGKGTSTQPQVSQSNPASSAVVPATLNPLPTKLQLSSKEKFKIERPNSRNTTIPIDPVLPEGLVFKVQVGAFRNPLPPNAFNRITPMAAETTPQGLMRYTAGLFLNFGNANVAKTEIRKIGYPDAFVVAFYNGKRISLSEALKMSGQTVAPEILADAAGGSRITGNTTDGTNATEQEVAAKDVAKVSGLFYTVQVGVFSRPVTNGKLNAIPDLHSERTATGSIRYASGKFSSIGQASQAKLSIVEKGIPDAFVTAYFNGRRVSMAEAERLEKEGALLSGTSADATNQQPANQPAAPVQPVNTNQRNGAYIQANTLTFSKEVKAISPITDTGIVYCVQLGAFRELIPVDVANQFLLFADRGVRHYVDSANNYTVFMIAPVRTYEEAVKLKEEVIARGIIDAFLVAWRDSKKISISQARAMTGK